jgi:2-methylcitrate dehydratase PrpD
MTHIQKLVTNVLSIRYEDFKPAVIDYAKDRIIDTVGAMLGGACSSGTKMVFDLVKDWGGKKESTIFAMGGKVPAANAALVMGIMARANDFEPAGGPEIDGRVFPGHYSATTVTTAFAMAEKLEVDGKGLITALILGDDLASRIGAAGNMNMEQGWDPSGLCGRFGAAAIAGRLMGLNETKMLNALGIVLNQISGSMQSTLEFTHCFNLSQGMAGWNGILSAELAGRGFTGPHDPVTGPAGYFTMYCNGSSPDTMIKNLSREYYADESFKIYPSCHMTHGSIDSTMKIVLEHDINPDDIAEIAVILAPVMKGSLLAQPFRVGLYPQDSAIMNIPFGVACAVLHKGVKLEHFKDEAILDPRINELTGKIKTYFTLKGKMESAEVTVKLKNGEEFSAYTEIPKGDRKKTPLSRDEIKEKFITSAAFSRAIDQDKVERALALIENLEKLGNINLLVEQLIP